MRKIKFSTLHISFLILSFTCFLLVGCSDSDTIEGTLELSEAKKVVSAVEGHATIQVNSNTEWKLGQTEPDKKWFSVSKADGNTNTFLISYDNNDKITSRTTEFYVVTTDGKGFQKFELTQLGDNPIFELEKNELEVVSRSRTHRIGIESNIPKDLIQKEIVYDGQTGEGWILGLEVEDGIVKFKTERNQLTEERQATIILSLKAESGDQEDVWAELEVTQMSMSNDVPPTLKDFTYAKALPVGEVEENVSIEGNMVIESPSENFRPGTKTYIIQDGDSKAIVLESMEDLNFAPYDKIQLLLDGTEVAMVNDDGFNYKLIKGITKSNILEQNPDSQFKPKSMYMRDLTDDHLLSLVTLKDVEFSIPFGGFTNINEGYITDQHTRVYPNSIRDINGNSMYLLTNREVTYRGESVPLGSGTLTGIVVQATNLCYGKLEQYSIRQLKKSDVNFANDRNSSFSKVLVEWDCTKPANFVEGMTRIDPVIGDKNTTLQKEGSTGFFSKYDATNRVYFLAIYRGKSTIANGGYVSTKWGTGEHWLISNLSTMGIAKQLSLQIEANSSTSNGPRDFAVEYSLDGTNWTLVENYTLHGQISGAVKTVDVIPGFKMYNFNLPMEILNKNNVQIRLRNTSDVTVDGKAVAAGSTCRLVHVSIKHNK